MSGLSPEWSERMVLAELKNILRDDIGAVRAQLHKAVVEGLMSEAEYRQYLQNLGLSPEVVDARVTAAVIALSILSCEIRNYIAKGMDGDGKKSFNSLLRDQELI